MLKYIGKRLLMLIPVILITSFLIFWAMSLTGGDPAMIVAGEGATTEEIEAVREELGLNDPFMVRYFNYVKGMVTGDMGKSYVTLKAAINSFLKSFVLEYVFGAKTTTRRLFGYFCLTASRVTFISVG